MHESRVVFLSPSWCAFPQNGWKCVCQKKKCAPVHLTGGGGWSGVLFGQQNKTFGAKYSYCCSCAIRAMTAMHMNTNGRWKAEKGGWGGAARPRPGGALVWFCAPRTAGHGCRRTTTTTVAFPVGRRSSRPAPPPRGQTRASSRVRCEGRRGGKVLPDPAEYTILDTSIWAYTILGTKLVEMSKNRLEAQERKF